MNYLINGRTLRNVTMKAKKIIGTEANKVCQSASEIVAEAVKMAE